VGISSDVRRKAARADASAEARSAKVRCWELPGAFSFRFPDCTDPERATVDSPDRRQSNRLCRQHIVVDALPNVEHPAGATPPSKRHPENLKRRFVTPRLLRSRHALKVSFAGEGAFFANRSSSMSR